MFIEKLSHKFMIWSALVNTAITTLAFFFFVVKAVVQ